MAGTTNRSNARRSHIPRDILLSIAREYSAKKMKIFKDMDIQCQKELDEAQGFYESILNKFDAKAESIEICKIETSTILTEADWFKNISEMQNQLIDFFLEYVKQQNYSFTYEFKTQTIKDQNSYYLYPKYINYCWKELKITY